MTTEAIITPLLIFKNKLRLYNLVARQVTNPEASKAGTE